MIKLKINHLIGHDNKIQKIGIVHNGSQSKDVRCLSLTKNLIRIGFFLMIFISLFIGCECDDGNPEQPYVTVTCIDPILITNSESENALEQSNCIEFDSSITSLGVYHYMFPTKWSCYGHITVNDDSIRILGVLGKN